MKWRSWWVLEESLDDVLLRQSGWRCCGCFWLAEVARRVLGRVLGMGLFREFLEVLAD